MDSTVPGRAKLEILFIFLFVVLSNKWMNWEEGVRYVQADDSASYLKISRAAPSLPTSPPNFHHAQRIFVHYLVGTGAKVTRTDLGSWYLAAALLLSLLVAYLAQLLLLEIKVPDFARRLLLAAFLLSPYVFRYYWIAPPMLADLLFVVGLGIMFWGLMRVRLGVVFAGCVIALLGRQNIILTLPGIALWMAIVPAWRIESFLRRSMKFAALFITVIGLFVYSGHLVSPWALPMENGPSTFISFFVWLASDQFTVRMLGEHLVRILFPGALLCSLMAAFFITQPRHFWRAIPMEFFASLLIAAGLFSQPLVVTPMDLGGNQSRQAAIGLLALLIAAGYLFRFAPDIKEKAPQGISPLRAGILLTTFHHMYTVVGPSNVIAFMAIQLTGCALSALALRKVLTTSAGALE